MSDLISRQAAIDTICKLCPVVGDHHKCKGYPETSTWCDEAVALRALPSAEPERKTGRWNFIGDNLFECTCCLTVYSTQQLNGLRNDNSDPYAPRFCPNCGASMTSKEGAQNEPDK